jgi:hypothetical protein
VTGTFVPNNAVIEARFLVIGDALQWDTGPHYRVTGASFTLLGTTLLPVEATTCSFGRTRVYHDHLTIRPDDVIPVVGRYC